LSPVYLLEEDEIAGGVDDGDRHLPAVLLRLGDHGVGELLRVLEVDRRAMPNDNANHILPIAL
jgi:hypothetical protein